MRPTRPARRFAPSASFFGSIELTEVEAKRREHLGVNSTLFI
jgi:hypothetical protein